MSEEIKSDYSQSNIQKFNTKSLTTLIHWNRVLPTLRDKKILFFIKLNKVLDLIKDNINNLLIDIKTKLLTPFKRRLIILKRNKLFAIIKGNSMWIKGEYFTQNIITIQGVQDKRTL
jgi:hypothetical protein